MAYIENRIVHDADAHLMETPYWLRDHADPAIRERIAPPSYVNELRQTGDNDAQLANIDAAFAKLHERHRSDEYRADEAAEIMNRKNFAATGAFVAEDRPRAIDLIGVASQLVFNTFHNSRLHDWEHEDDLDFAYGVARAHNRAMLEFCSVDPRLLATAYVPLADFGLARATAEQSIKDGAAALLVASACPRRHSPSHTGLFPVWAAAEEAGFYGYHLTEHHATPLSATPSPTVYLAAAARETAAAHTWSRHTDQVLALYARITEARRRAQPA